MNYIHFFFILKALKLYVLIIERKKKLKNSPIEIKQKNNIDYLRYSDQFILIVSLIFLTMIHIYDIIFETMSYILSDPYLRLNFKMGNYY